MEGDVTTIHALVAPLGENCELGDDGFQPVFDGFEAAVEVVLQILQTLANVVSLEDQRPYYSERQCSGS
jgi:hypothetical protein